MIVRQQTSELLLIVAYGISIHSASVIVLLLENSSNWNMSSCFWWHGCAIQMCNQLSDYHHGGDTWSVFVSADRCILKFSAMFSGLWGIVSWNYTINMSRCHCCQVNYSLTWILTNLCLSKSFVKAKAKLFMRIFFQGRGWLWLFFWLFFFLLKSHRWEICNMYYFLS